MRNEDDPLTYQDAARHMQMLREYWFVRSHDINVRLEEISRVKATGTPDIIYCVRSNLVRGLPPVPSAVPISEAA
jgi:hypothetical protein